VFACAVAVDSNTSSAKLDKYCITPCRYFIR
jgi:hypothetical protein